MQSMRLRACAWTWHHCFNRGPNCRQGLNSHPRQHHQLGLQKAVESQKARANKGAKRATLLLAQHGSPRPQFSQLCMQFQSAKCQKGDTCRFSHLCAHPLASGQACGQQHSAFDHQQQPHWLMTEPTMSVSTFQETSKDNKATDPIDLHEVPCDDSTMVDTPETNLAPPPVSTIHIRFKPLWTFHVLKVQEFFWTFAQVLATLWHQLCLVMAANAFRWINWLMPRWIFWTIHFLNRCWEYVLLAWWDTLPLLLTVGNI